ncbi:MAG: exodeoxyribonuclease V subunit gamma [Sporichthyaceae bacterium]|nr:exodeoxyribonuclease V subunit gamma [Sporichthyaceae bacterium]
MLIVHRAASGAALAAGLGEVLADPPDDPFASEVIAVPAKGVERWIGQRLSHVLGATAGDGVCANVEFPWPSPLLDEALQAASPEHAEAVERWAPDRSRWPLVAVIDACAATEPWCQPLAQHLGVNGEDKGRRMAVASRVAHLFDAYAQARPEMLRRWAERRDERGDGTPLEDDLRWQAELWRRLRERLATPSPAELLDDACARLRRDPDLSKLPERISIFGASRLSPARLAVFAALAEHRDAHLWLHHASPALWQTVAREQNGALRRRDDTTRASLNNPLLTSLSRDLLELQQLLGRCAPGFTDVLLDTDPLPDTLLGRLKRDLADDTFATTPPALHGDDKTVQVHACHGRTRQVEVLREVIVGLLADDPTLEPRDVLVMCPDVETFAPLIAATFSLGAEEAAAHPAARLRVRLADRALRQTNALLGVLSQLLELGTARITASQVLDLAGTAAVRQRFGFDDDEIERLRDWTVSAGVRWGLDREHRRTWQLGEIGQGTWREGLDRLLLGVTMEGAEGSLDEVVPLDDVDSADIDLAGRFAELVDRLAAAQLLMDGQHTADEWTTGLEQAVLSLAATERDAEWQQLQFHSELAEIAEGAAGSTALLDLADVRSLLAAPLSGRPTRASFRTGTLTVCTLVPMRSVPHRVVCLLGIDDGVFPRQSTRDGDDVLARDPWVGERDPRSEDRQLFLDAISAAEEHLVITYTGADERTNAPVPPAVPLGELLDALDRTATAPGQDRVRDVITTQHPLQPFDARNFTPGELCTPGPFSFDPLGYDGAVAASSPRSQPQPFLLSPLPAQPPADIALPELLKLLEHPARGFLRQRLQVAVTREEEEPADALPVELNSLELWAVGERVLRDRVAGVEVGECMTLELRRGALPPGLIGLTALREVGRNVEKIVEASADERAHEPESQDIDISLAGIGLPDGTRLTGTVAGVRGDTIVSLTYSKLAARQRLHAWVELVALTVSHPGHEWRALAVGRGSKPATALRSCLGPLSAGEAEAALAEIVSLYRAGLRAPLPLPVKTAGQYAFLRGKGTGVPAARIGAAAEWQSGRFPGEQADAEHALVYGLDAPMSVITDHPPGEGERGAGWHPDETDRFGLLARRLWARLLAAEKPE